MIGGWSGPSDRHTGRRRIVARRRIRRATESGQRQRVGVDRVERLHTGFVVAVERGLPRIHRGSGCADWLILVRWLLDWDVGDLPICSAFPLSVSGRAWRRVNGQTVVGGGPVAAVNSCGQAAVQGQAAGSSRAERRAQRVIRAATVTS